MIPLLLAATLSTGVIAIDGDTLKLRDGTSLRLETINAPDHPRSAPCRTHKPGYVSDDAKAEAARAALQALITGRAVRWHPVDADRCRKGWQFGDTYGRAIIHASAGGVDLAKAMLAKGLVARMRGCRK